MPSVTYLSKTWTVDRSLGYLRNLVNQLAPDKIKTLPLIDYLNLSQLEAAQLLVNANNPDYGKYLTVKNSAAGADEVELVVDGSVVSLATADLSQDATAVKLRINNLVKIRYTKSGATKLAIEMNPVEFEGLINNYPQNKENVYWCLLGEALYIRNRITGIALESDWGDLIVYYNRYPVKLSAADSDRLGDTLDVRDGYARLVIYKAKLLIYEELQQQPPEALTGDINSMIEQIRQATNSEQGFINDYSHTQMS